MIKTTTPRLSRSKNEIVEFYDRLKKIYLMDEPVTCSRRESKRIRVTVPICISTMDEDGTIYHQQAISRDVSRHGIGMVCPNPIGREYALLTIQPTVGPVFDVLARVVHSKEVGYYYHVGLEFMTHGESQ
ncbi:MAG: PilZ domain-containing protein [Planctomycetota bacterium]